MASIVARGGKFQAFVRRAGHPTACRTFATKRAAERWAREFEAALEQTPEAGTRTLGDAIRAYLASDAGERLNGYERGVLDWWDARLGRRRLVELRRGDFYAARDALRGADGQRLAPATLNRRVSMVSAALSHAARLDWIAANPARIRRLREDNLIEHHVDPDDLERLLAACRKSREPALAPMVLSAVVSGARAGELQRLTWRDVDLEQGIAGLLRTKSGRRRPIAIRGPALEELRHMHAAHAAAGGAPEARVFAHADGRAPFDYGRAWRAARAEARLPALRFHDLRHLAASTLAEAGTSTRELMAYLGHSSPATTARYAHLVDRHIAQLGDVLAERLLGGAH